MPLYELIILGRVGTAKGSSNLIKQLAYKVFEEGGVVRKAQVLGDRVMTQQVKGIDQKKHLVGRYMQLLYDGSPKCQKELEKVAKQSFEVMRVKSFVVKDFFNDAQMFRMTKEFQSPIKTVENQEFQQKLLEIKQKKDLLDSHQY